MFLNTIYRVIVISAWLTCTSMINTWTTYGEPRLYNDGETDLIIKT
jgi:hypothetical protein